MAEDDMLLNFTVPDVLSTKSSFKGGNWKIRWNAKRAADKRQHKVIQGEGKRGDTVWETKTPRYPSADEASAEDDAAEQHPESRPTKRQRTTEKDATPSKGPNGANYSGFRKEKPRQIISGLFTYNPESKTKSDAAQPPTVEDIEPSNAPLRNKLDTFTSLGLSSSLAMHLLNKLELTAPTAIQKAAIPQLLKTESDAFIQAETGSGKTLAYLIPLVQRLIILSKESKEQASDTVHRNSGLFAIILAPTRELSKQISVVLERLLGCAHWIVAGTVLGGEKKKSEKARLRKGLNILVATPGRLADHLEHTEALDVSSVRWLILDEGDRLMELGFENEIQRIVANLNLRMKKGSRNTLGLPAKRITILCSATMKMDVQRLGEISLKEAVHISASAEDSTQLEEEQVDQAFSAPAQLKQSYAVVPAKLRLVTLTALLKRTFARKGSVTKTILFLSCADSVDFHFHLFCRADHAIDLEKFVPPAEEKEALKTDKSPGLESRTNAIAPLLSSKENTVYIFRLHGSLPQAIRTSTLAAYAKCKDPAVLICTDVASRGLDVPDVDFVIEYDPAFSKEDHIHRIGRTARAGRDGRTLIFLQPGPEEGYVDMLRESRRDAGKTLIRHDAEELLKRGFMGAGVVSMGPSWADMATEFQLDIERWALTNPIYLEKARRAYQSHVRAYATHVAAERHIFNIKELHLGHLAKAFALRDKPGSIKVPGLRPASGADKTSKRTLSANGRKPNALASSRTAGSRQSKSSGKDHGIDDVIMVDEDEGRRQMRRKVKEMMVGASEFNIG